MHWPRTLHVGGSRQGRGRLKVQRLRCNAYVHIVKFLRTGFGLKKGAPTMKLERQIELLDRLVEELSPRALEGDSAALQNLLRTLELRRKLSEDAAAEWKL